jgi:hypothetical protein
MSFNISQAVGAFAGVVALGGALMLLGAAPASRFGVIEAGRINIREPDGTLRMVISSAAMAPGIIVKGHEQPHPSRAAAGMIFFNDEGTENGGLIFGGRAGGGAASGYGSLTFDRYEQDQVVQIVQDEEGGTRRSGLQVFDRPEARMDFPAIARAGGLSGAAQKQAFAAAHVGGVTRGFVGRDEAGDAEVALRDAHGAVRLVLKVTADGAASLAFLDGAGRVVRTIAPGGQAASAP